MTVTISLVSLKGAMAIGMPVAFSLLACGIALMAYLGIYDSQIVAQKILEGADSFVLLAIPFFLLAGELMNAGGVAFLVARHPLRRLALEACLPLAVPRATRGRRFVEMCQSMMW